MRPPQATTPVTSETPSEANPLPTERIFLRESIKQIESYLAGKTTHEQQVIVADKYKGKWIKESVYFRDVKDSGERIIVAVSVQKAPNLAEPPLVFAYMSRDMLPRLTHLHEGDLVTIQGQFYSYDDAYGLALLNAFVLDDAGPSPDADSIPPLPQTITNAPAISIPPTWITTAAGVTSSDGIVYLGVERIDLDGRGIPWVVSAYLSTEGTDLQEKKWYGFFNLEVTRRQLIEIAGRHYSISVLRCETNRVEMSVYTIP